MLNVSNYFKHYKIESRVSRHMHALVLLDETDVRHQSALRLV